MLKIQTGDKFGKLTVLGRIRNPGFGSRLECVCECGKKVMCSSANLATGNSTSCGCSRSTHGLSKTRAYAAWKAMHQRCYNPNANGYENYGGRGIQVDARWHDFEAFIADMGQPPPKTSLDRNDNSGPYADWNCRWAPWGVQQRNKRSNRSLTAFGRTQMITDWAVEFDLPLSTLRNRIDRGGWPIEDALTEPLRKGKPL